MYEIDALNESESLSENPYCGEALNVSEFYAMRGDEKNVKLQSNKIGF